MTQRKPALRPGARVLDALGTGTVLNSTGLPPICDPREWTWVQWEGDRGLKPARFADLDPETTP